MPESGTAPTAVDRPVVESGTSIATPEQAMRLLEARRAWTFAFGLGILCVLGAILVLLIGGDPFAQHLHLAALGANALVCAAFTVLRRDPARYRTRDMTWILVVGTVTNATGFYYWGVASAFIAVSTVAGYAYAIGATRLGAIVPTVVVIVTNAGIGVAELCGWLGQRGLVVYAPWITTAGQIVAIVAIQLIMAMAIVGGLDTRAQMQRVLAEHHAALRELAQRDAQLAEARQAEREARAPGEGRHTGSQLGRFRLGLVLGRGAMGEVYAATDERGAPCAVKLLAAHLLDNEDAQRRFQREARAVAALDVPNVVRVLDVSPPGAEQPYIAMERLDGRDLSDLIKERPTRDVGEVVAIVRAVAAGLDAAHAAGIVHRDLKPANVFAATTASGVVWKVLDFGVSKLFDADATQTHGNLVGTPGYMAPEQAKGIKVDRRADVYSLGVLAYRLITGRPVVVPGDPPRMIHEVVYRVPPQPSSFASVSPAVEAVLAIALAKSRDDRFATAGDLAAALAEAAAGVAPPSLVERAGELLRDAPWGAWLRDRHSATEIIAPRSRARRA